jgi:YbbR domain-containing protein
LDLSFAKLGKKTLPIHVPIHGEPLFGYRLAQSPQPFPRTVQVEGPADVVEQLKQIPTASIDLRGRFRDEVVFVNLYKHDKLIRFVGPENVKVALNFLQRKIKRTIQDVPIQSIDFLNTKMDSTLSPSRVDITLIGPQAHLSPLKNKDLVATVDGSKLVNKPEGSYTLPIQVKSPNPELKVIQTSPVHVTVVLKKRPEVPVPPRPLVPPPKKTHARQRPLSPRNVEKKEKDTEKEADDENENKKRRVRKVRKKRRRPKKVRRAPPKQRDNQ